jgi:hypothetical protein
MLCRVHAWCLNEYLVLMNCGTLLRSGIVITLVQARAQFQIFLLWE